MFCRPHYHRITSSIAPPHHRCVFTVGPRASKNNRTGIFPVFAGEYVFAARAGK